MSDIGLGLRTYLLTKTAVTNVVSTRIYPDVLPQNATFPAVVYSEFGSDHNDQLSGAAGLYHPRVFIDCYAATRSAANTLAEAIRGVLHGYWGAAGSETIRAAQLEGRVKDIVRPQDGSDLRQYRTRLSWRFAVTESIPSF